MCRCALIERSPLWPGEPAAGLHLQRADGQVELVVHDHDLLGLDAVAARQRRDRVPGVVHVGERDRQRDARRRRCAPRRRAPAPCPSSACAPWRSASSSTTSAPTLWRVRAYSSPGLPRPTTSRSAGGARDAASTGYSSPASPPSPPSDASAVALGGPRRLRPLRPRRLRPRPRPRRRRAAPRPARRRSSGSTSVATPSGSGMSRDAELVADRERRRRRPRSTTGMLPGMASTVRLKSSCSSRPPSLHARRPRRRGGAGSRRSPRRRGGCG